MNGSKSFIGHERRTSSLLLHLKRFIYLYIYICVCVCVDVGIWTGLGWPRIETVGGCL